jgi:hypothetical protein
LRKISPNFGGFSAILLAEAIIRFGDRKAESLTELAFSAVNPFFMTG